MADIILHFQFEHVSIFIPWKTKVNATPSVPTMIINYKYIMYHHGAHGLYNKKQLLQKQ